MSLIFFRLWNRFFHLGNNRASNTMQKSKYEELYAMLKKNWNKYYKPGQHLTIDEALAKFQGKSDKKQYFRCKSEK
jgi:hypothetical protein